MSTLHVFILIAVDSWDYVLQAIYEIHINNCENYK